MRQSALHSPSPYLHPRPRPHAPKLAPTRRHTHTHTHTPLVVPHIQRPCLHPQPHPHTLPTTTLTRTLSLVPRTPFTHPLTHTCLDWLIPWSLPHATLNTITPLRITTAYHHRSGMGWKSFWLSVEEFTADKFNELRVWMGETGCKFTGVVHANNGNSGYGDAGGTIVDAMRMMNGTCDLTLM